ncbi:MAG: ferrochelatase [Actinomycetota bacterium]
MTTGLLVMAYGTASGPDDVERYYTDIRGGRKPAPEQIQELMERYSAIGNTFPLDRITREQAAALEKELGLKAYVGYKHSRPFVGDAVAQMAADGIGDAVGIVMAPHYSGMSIGAYMERARRAQPPDLELTFVESWHLHPAFVDVLAARVDEARSMLDTEARRNDLVIFSAHSLPERIVAEGDPYPHQLRETAEAVAAKTGLQRFATGWQSAGRTFEPWLGPPLEETVSKAAADGHTAVVVCPCGFTADHLEVLYDVDIEAKRAAASAGIPLVRTRSMNAQPDFISAVATVVRDHMERR